MVSNKMLVLAVLALAAFQVRADNGEITDWCKPCTRLIDDFSSELKGEGPQNLYIRECNDVYLDDEDFNQKCQYTYTELFTSIRKFLNAGQDGAQICTTIGVCQDDQSALRQKFAALRQQHAVFQKAFGKFF